MSRKPVHKSTGLDSRQAVWDLIRERQTFTVRELRESTTLKLDTVRDYVKGLTAAGYLEQSGTDGRKAKLYKLVKDVGFDAPRVRKDGTPVVMGRGRERMWTIMPILKSFTARELAVQATMEDLQVKESAAADYLKHLCKAGYLRKTGTGRYFLLPGEHTGPRAPMVQRIKQVWDPNLQEVRWSNDQGGAHD